MMNDDETTAPEDAPGASTSDRDLVVVPDGNELSFGTEQQQDRDRKLSNDIMDSNETSLEHTLPQRASGFASLFGSFRKASLPAKSKSNTNFAPVNDPLAEDNVSLASCPVEFPSMAPVQEVHLSSETPVESSIDGDAMTSPSSQMDEPPPRDNLIGSELSINASDAGSVMFEDLLATMEDPLLQPEDSQEALEVLQPPHIVQDNTHSRSSSEAEDTSVVRETLQQGHSSATTTTERGDKARSASTIVSVDETSEHEAREGLTSTATATATEAGHEAGEFGLDAFVMIGETLLRHEQQQPALDNRGASHNKKIKCRLAVGAGVLALLLAVVFFMSNYRPAAIPNLLDPVLFMTRQTMDVKPEQGRSGVRIVLVEDVLVGHGKEHEHLSKKINVEDDNDAAFANPPNSTGEDVLSDDTLLDGEVPTMLNGEVPSIQGRILEQIRTLFGGLDVPTDDYAEAAPSDLSPPEVSEPELFGVLHVSSLRNCGILKQFGNVFTGHFKPCCAFLGNLPTFCKGLFVLVVALCMGMAGMLILLSKLSQSKVPKQTLRNSVSMKVKQEEQCGVPIHDVTEPPLVDLSYYDLVRKVDLKNMLRERNLPVSGNKIDLIERLVESYHKELDSLSYRCLQKRLKRQQLLQTGTKEELVARLIETGL